MSSQSSEKILQATLRLIARGGVDAVRYRDVAQESGVALGTISYQFSTREELIRSAFEHHLTTNAKQLREVVASATVHEARDVAQLIVDILKSESADPNRMHLAEYELLVYASRDPQMATMLTEWDRMLISEFGAILERVGVLSPLGTAEALLELSRGHSLVRLGLEKRDFSDFQRRIERVLLASGGAPKAEAEPARAKRGRLPTRKRKPERGPTRS